MDTSDSGDDNTRHLWRIGFTVLCCWTGYFATLIIYRITFHPLAKFPGPRLAAASYLYEFWYDVVCWGRYTHKIGRIHQHYGPIIRINPDELHCNDPAFIDQVYPVGRNKRDKPRHFLRFFPISSHAATVATGSHDTHRQRRKSLNKFFSKATVLELEDLIHHNAQKLCDKLLASRDKGVVNVTQAYGGYTADLIMAYCFGETSGFLDQPGWVPGYKATVNILFSLGHTLRHFPMLAYLMELLPLPFVKVLSTDVGVIMEDLKIRFPEKIKQTSNTSDSVAFTNRPTIFSELLEDPSLPQEEKSLERLSSEATALLVGGTESPAVALAVFTFHTLDNPAVLERLHTEVSSVVSDGRNIPKWQELEQLPFLSAVLSESLRLVHGVSGRLARVATDEEIHYSGSWTPGNAVGAVTVNHVVPRGYALGMSAYLMHYNETIFPEPSTFLPQRWLDERGDRDRSLDHYLLSFSKGSRQCVGMHLGYAELYICMAALVMRVFPHMRLCETTRQDVDYDHDELIGKPVSQSKGVRVTIH